MYGKMIPNKSRKVTFMSEKNLKRLHLIYGIVLDVALCVVGALAIAMCVDIYNSGPSPFTRQSVAEHFAKISVFVYILAALVLGGAILNIALPLPNAKHKGAANSRVILHKLSQKLTNIDSDVANKIEKQRILRLVMIVICSLLVVGATVLSIVQSISGYDASDVNINGQVIKATFIFLRYFTIPFIYAVVSAYVCNHSVKKELTLVKNALSSKKTKSILVDSENSGEATDKTEGTFTKLTNELYEVERKSYKPSKIRTLVSSIVTVSFIVVAVVFIILGVSNGGMADVVTKAINICTECIGMG